MISLITFFNYNQPVSEHAIIHHNQHKYNFFLLVSKIKISLNLFRTINGITSFYIEMGKPRDDFFGNLI